MQPFDLCRATVVACSVIGLLAVAQIGRVLLSREAPRRCHGWEAYGSSSRGSLHGRRHAALTTQLRLR